jgi:homoserine O-acetyltransferase/O-succinyltransferase
MPVLTRTIIRIWLPMLLVSCTTLAQAGPEGLVEKTFQLGDFRLESGQVLPNAYIKYTTHGKLNRKKNNAVVLPSSFGSASQEYNFLIGNALDSTRYFLILPQLFANGHSSSPSNTPPPFDGPRFPTVSIQDNVRASHELVTKQFGLTSIRAVVGFSMGAQQAFQWAVDYPEMVASLVAYCGAAKTYPHGYTRLESAIAALQADSGWNNGDYSNLPLRGLKAWTLHWLSWIFSQEWYRKELFRTFGVESLESYLQQQIVRDQSIDANDKVSQVSTWQQHDISKHPRHGGNLERALAAIRCPVLYMPAQTDLYFPLEDALYEMKFLKNVEFKPIPSLWGHLAGAGINQEDNDFLNKSIRAFLAEKK